MGQMKKLLDTLFELEEALQPCDLDWDYELNKQKQQEQLPYEELLTTSNKNN